MSLLDDAQAIPLLSLIERDSQDFTFSQWEEKLFNVKCFRVVGLDYLLPAYGIPHKSIFDNDGFKLKAFNNIPREWVRRFPTRDNGWSVYKRDQFSHAYSRKACRFDKACISILIACAALDDAGILAPRFFDYVKIRPQMYFVDGFTVDFFNQYIRNFPTEEMGLVTHCGQITTDRLLQIAGKHLVTKKTGRLIVEHLNQRYPTIRNVVREPYSPARRLSTEIIAYDATVDYGLPELVAADGARTDQAQPQTH